MNILAAISGDQLLSALLSLVIWGVIMAVLGWGLQKINPPEPWMKVGMVILVIMTVVILVNILLGLQGNAFIRW